VRRAHRSAHLALALAALLPALLLGAFALRGAAPVDPAVRLLDAGVVE
jgi:hypothetical protein